MILDAVHHPHDTTKECEHQCDNCILTASCDDDNDSYEKLKSNNHEY